jgi:hypothetical protein
MNSDRKRDLRALAITESSVRFHGTLTVPRSFGVYRIGGNARGTRQYRFGNHPIRQRELIREFRTAPLEALFLERLLALELAKLLNEEK